MILSLVCCTSCETCEIFQTIMPRTTEQQRVLKALVLERRRRSEMCLYCYLLDMKDEIRDELDEIVELRYELMSSSR